MFHNTPLQKYGHNAEIASNFYDDKMEIRPDENLEINTLTSSIRLSEKHGFKKVDTGQRIRGGTVRVKIEEAVVFPVHSYTRPPRCPSIKELVKFLSHCWHLILWWLWLSFSTSIV